MSSAEDLQKEINRLKKELELKEEEISSKNDEINELVNMLQFQQG